jgi:predicted MFS family arabinose efflux permease
VVVSFVIGVGSLAGFVIAEAHHAEPMMPLRLFRSPTFSGANLLTLLLYAALSGLLFFLPFNLIEIQGYQATEAGAALLPFVITMFLLSRWAGSLVDRHGSKLPLVVGPLIAAVGFTLFSWPGVDARNYWRSFFPAVMVMSIGMAISVAPLTTTVMGSVDEHRAGTASGINNAVSRTAALFAIAVFGAVMVSAFQRNLAGRLDSLSIPTEIREQIELHARDTLNVNVPENLSEDSQTAIRQAIRNSFVAGFRLVAYLSGGLAAASALAAWLLIEGRNGRDAR